MSPSVPAASAVLVGTPKAGSVDEINAVATFVDDIVDDCYQYNVSVSGAARYLSGAKSVGVTRIQNKLLERLLPGSDVLSESAGQAKKTFNSYASEVELIHKRADQIKQDVRDDLQSISSAMSEIERIAREIRVSASYSWQAVPPGQLPDPVLSRAADDLSSAEQSAAKQNLRMLYENQWLGAAVRWKTALEHIDSLKAEWARLIDERRIAEKALVDALDDTAIGHMISLGSGAGTSAKRTIALVISGELWGESNEGTPYSTSHPLLKKLIGTEDGSHFQNLSITPEEIASNWDTLEPEEQAILIAAVPGVIGNLPGLSGEVRNLVNRAQMTFFREHPQLLTPEQLRLAAGLQNILNREDLQLRSGQGADPPIQVLGLDLAVSPPRAAVSYGNVDTAGNVTWLVPGMLNDASEGIKGMDEAGVNLFRTQGRVSGGNQNAVIAWLGYDTPGDPLKWDFGVLASESAITGASRLVAEINGLDASRLHGGGELPTRNVAAHSYGTTVASIALKDVQYPVDTFVMIGSAGLDTAEIKSLGDLKVKEVSPGQSAIYTTHADGDHLAPAGAGASGRGQPNPNANGYGLQNFSPVYGGAISFSAEGDTSLQLKGTNGHSLIGSGLEPGGAGISASVGQGYLDSATESINSISKITTGNIDLKLQHSFQITEAERVNYIIDPATGNLYPYRVKETT
ncbi:alpha/beta hydrolase [Leucobacter sp. UT-8R-CII-1-4]|uniref:alpha/beta hydrolase n=1 Tax=Leucobacter sp. UT-8R-CII-1-4 TaxID=3040075 RepID=UPI0024A8FEA2|nr:alpha/beta hydrolase [Leucobacter sp. UT-8R-CII-1-4]MDI6023936.1 alpha/beta hydrolase [Leucobacter sp. UT-8R-CII-1-4]